MRKYFDRITEVKIELKEKIIQETKPKDRRFFSSAESSSAKCVRYNSQSIDPYPLSLSALPSFSLS